LTHGTSSSSCRRSWVVLAESPGISCWWRSLRWSSRTTNRWSVALERRLNVEQLLPCVDNLIACCTVTYIASSLHPHILLITVWCFFIMSVIMYSFSTLPSHFIQLWVTITILSVHPFVHYVFIYIILVI